jgi:MFS family permease
VQRQQVQAGQGPTNHPLAPRMCAIAFLSYNLSLACLYGTFSVLLSAVEAKFGATRDLSSLGIPLSMLGIAMTSPFAGALAGKVSIRLLMLTGASMNLLAYVALALSTSIYLNLAVYALLIGPGLCLTATVLPPTLVTRWYAVHRGRALGLITMPIAIAIVPPVAVLMLRGYGLSATYGLMALIMALLLVPLCFVIDYPPSLIDLSGENAAAETSADPGMSVAQLMRNGRFWLLSLAFAAITTAAIFQGAHLMPMVADWGINATEGSTLLSAAALAGLAGTTTFGWLADRLGGARTLALVCFNSGVLWAIMLLHPSYPMTLIVVALLGLHGAAVVATVGLALSQQFGQATFGRAFGLANLMGLPFNVLGVPIGARIYMRTGSYSSAIVGIIGFFVLMAVLAATIRSPKTAPAVGLNRSR